MEPLPKIKLLEQAGQVSTYFKNIVINENITIVVALKRPQVLNAERLGKLNNEESTPIVSIPFKVTRDYTSGDASEGFED